MQLLILTHKYLFHRSTLPEVFSEYFTINANIHSHNTRSKENIHLPSYRLSYGHRCLKNKAASLWNALPFELRSNMTVCSFKNKLREYLSLSIMSHW
jgi:hypothetical protein